MTLPTHCEDRKQLVQTLSEFLGIEAEYLRTPTYAYRIGNLTVNRDGSITGDLEALAAIQQPLTEHGYIEAPTEKEPETETVTEDFKVPTDEEITHTCVSLPLHEFTLATLSNLIRMLYARQVLIRKMVKSDDLYLDNAIIPTLQSDGITNMAILERVLKDSIENGFLKGIQIEDGRLGINFPFESDQPTRWWHCAALLLAMADKAKNARRVSATLIESEDEELKYFCHSFLLQLGFGGAEHKDLRTALLGHLTGYAAFRTTEKMKKHSEKCTALRRAAKEEATHDHD